MSASAEDVLHVGARVGNQLAGMVCRWCAIDTVKIRVQANGGHATSPRRLW